MATKIALQAQDYSPDPKVVRLKTLPDALVTDDWRNVLIARGFGWTFSVGDLTTSIQGGGAGTVLKEDEPEWEIDIPQGQTFIPLRITASLESGLIATDADESEVCIYVDRTQYGGSLAADGTVETPVNMRTDIVAGCPCNCLSALSSAAATTAARSLCLAHTLSVAEITSTGGEAIWKNTMLKYEPETPPFIVGPATVVCFWGGTVRCDGFSEVFFLSIPSALVTNLV